MQSRYWGASFRDHVLGPARAQPERIDELTVLETWVGGRRQVWD